MDIASISSSARQTSLADRQLIADNLDTFLQLLTTQLKNQDPLEPLDTNEFTSQLVQFSSVEQDVKSNGLLEQLVGNSAVASGQVAVSYIGKVVSADGATTQLSNGAATWRLNASEDGTATYTIRDSRGTIVYSRTGDIDFDAVRLQFLGAQGFRLSPPLPRSSPRRKSPRSRPSSKRSSLGPAWHWSIRIACASACASITKWPVTAPSRRT